MRAQAGKRASLLLSNAARILDDGDEPTLDLAVAEIAEAELEK
jgi:hypothetical protein